MFPRFRTDTGCGKWSAVAPPSCYSPPQQGQIDIPRQPFDVGVRGDFHRFSGSPLRGTWVETEAPGGGGCYYYHTESRETTWSRPVGPGINIIQHKNFRGEVGGVPRNQELNSTVPVDQTVSFQTDNVSSSSWNASVGCQTPPPSALRFQLPQMQIQSPGFCNPRMGSVATRVPITVPPPFPPFPVPFMMNLPWNPAPQLPPPPFSVPPPSYPVISLIPPKVDPSLTLNSSEWSEHTSPEGTSFYYNSITGVSSWEKPKTLMTSGKMEQKETETKVKKKIKEAKVSRSPVAKESINEGGVGTTEDFRKPVLCKHVVGASWCVVFTNDKKMFYFNPAKKESVWERPAELYEKEDVDEIIKTGYKELENQLQKKTEIAEISKSTVSKSSQQHTLKNEVMISELMNGKSEVGYEVDLCKIQEEIIEETKPSEIKVGDKTSITEHEIGSSATIKIEDKSPETKLSDIKTEPTIIPDTSIVLETPAPVKLSASEAEARAAETRASIPFDVRIQKFREMLMDKNVSAFSPWEKELRKIVFDPRYLLLTCKERKAAFDNYVKERAEVEMKEKKEKIEDAKEKFSEFIKEVCSEKLTYAEFEKKFAGDVRMKLIEKSKERKDLFMEHFDENRRKRRKMEGGPDKRDCADKQSSHCITKTKAAFMDFLERKVQDYHISWGEVYEDFNLGSDLRFQILTGFEMGDLFRLHQSRLKDKKKRTGRESDLERKNKKSRHASSSRHKKSKSKRRDADAIKIKSKNADESGESDGEIVSSPEH